MTPSVLALLTALTASPADRGDELRAVTYVRQGMAVQLGGDALAGGVGGGIGFELTWRDRYLATTDANVLWLLGNAASMRLALGVQRSGTYAPAGWIATRLLTGDRIELLREDGSRPPSPRFAAGLRASPLRFLGRYGTASLLEPGVLADVAGGWHVELTVLQVGARW